MRRGRSRIRPAAPDCTGAAWNVPWTIEGDGYGSGASVLSCGAPAGYSLSGGDCDEASTAIHPARPDDCTTMLGVDDDCDGVVDDEIVLLPWYPDGDAVGVSGLSCTIPKGTEAPG